MLPGPGMNEINTLSPKSQSNLPHWSGSRSSSLQTFHLQELYKRPSTETMRPTLNLFGLVGITEFLQECLIQIAGLVSWLRKNVQI
jgi:hypothetical protein